MILRRLGAALLPMAAVVAILFFAVRLVPGDPAVAALGETATPAQLDAFRTQNGLDRPLAAQFATYAAGLLALDFGRSLVNDRSVGAEIGRVLPSTLELTVAALLFGVAVGVPAGMLAAVRRGGVADLVTRFVSLLGLSFPTFYIGVLLILVFALGLGWFPVIGAGDGRPPSWGEHLGRLVLPAISAGLVMVAYITRATRASMLDVLDEDYMRTARAKGIGPGTVLVRHGLRNALVPIITVVGLQFGLLIGNTVLIEIVFNRPGLGKLVISALGQRDYQLVQGAMVVYAGIVALTGLVTDLAATFANPRLRLT